MKLQQAVHRLLHACWLAAQALNAKWLNGAQSWTSLRLQMELWQVSTDNPVLRGKLLQLPAAYRPLFFVGQPLDVLKTLRTLLPDAPSGQAYQFFNGGSYDAEGKGSLIG